jgi:hypothetical protein
VYCSFSPPPRSIFTPCDTLPCSAATVGPSTNGSCASRNAPYPHAAATSARANAGPNAERAREALAGLQFSAARTRGTRSTNSATAPLHAATTNDTAYTPPKSAI